jgi:hypothetical protein
MCEESPTSDNTNGPKVEKVSLEELNKLAIRDSLFDNLARYPHDFREVDGKQVHDFHCRRCALTVRLNGLRNRVLTLIRDVKEAIGEMRDG